MPRKRHGFDCFRWFLDDWRGSTARAELSLAHREIYREICEWEWTNRGRGEGGVDPSVEALAKRVGAHPNTIRAALPVLAPYFDVIDGKWSHPKVRSQVERMLSYKRGGERAAEKRGTLKGTRKGAPILATILEEEPPLSPKGEIRFVPELVDRWNDFAGRHGLKLLVKPLQADDRRVRAYRARLRDCPRFWEELEEAVSRRSAFYRGDGDGRQPQPTFSQATRKSYFNEKILGREMCAAETEEDRARRRDEELYAEALERSRQPR